MSGIIKKEPQKTELDTNEAKNGQFRIFTCQAANSLANGDFRGEA